MAIIGTTIVPGVSFKGQSFRIYIEDPQYLQFVNMNNGVQVGSLIGYISQIDKYGNSILVTPYMPSDVIGYIATGLEIEIIE